eukprot:scaffold284192_cov83-Cyclotella_meneghiniana.AAC.4
MKKLELQQLGIVSGMRFSKESAAMAQSVRQFRLEIQMDSNPLDGEGEEEWCCDGGWVEVLSSVILPITKDQHSRKQFNSEDKLADDTVVAVRTKFEIVGVDDGWPKMRLDTTTLTSMTQTDEWELPLRKIDP